MEPSTSAFTELQLSARPDSERFSPLLMLFLSFWKDEVKCAEVTKAMLVYCESQEMKLTERFHTKLMGLCYFYVEFLKTGNSLWWYKQTNIRRVVHDTSHTGSSNDSPLTIDYSVYFFWKKIPWRTPEEEGLCLSMYPWPDFKENEQAWTQRQRHVGELGSDGFGLFFGICWQ